MRKFLLLSAACALALDGSRRQKMKVTFGDLITSGAGSAGGHTYSRNRGGAYRKNKPIPLQPNSERQRTIRMGVATFSAGWRDLSDDEREAWNNAAANVNLVNSLGRTFQPTGHQYFVALNQTLNNWKIWATASGLYSPAAIADPISEPPALYSPDSFNISGLTITSGSPLIELDLVNNYTGSAQTTFAVYATPGLSTGIGNPGSAYRFIALINAPAGSSTIDLQTAWAYIFGAIPAGKRIFIKMQAADPLSGQQAIPLSLNDISI